MGRRIYIDNAYGDSPPPLVFGVRLSNKRQELSGTFLAVRGRPEEPEKKTEQWMEVFMSFLLLAGCTVATVHALRHVLGGCVFHEFCTFQDCLLVILASFCGSGSSRAAGGQQEAHPDAK